MLYFGNKGGGAMVRKMFAEMQPFRKIVRVDRAKL